MQKMKNIAAGLGDLERVLSSLPLTREERRKIIEKVRGLPISELPEVGNEILRLVSQSSKVSAFELLKKGRKITVRYLPPKDEYMLAVVRGVGTLPVYVGEAPSGYLISWRGEKREVRGVSSVEEALKRAKFFAPSRRMRRLLRELPSFFVRDGEAVVGVKYHPLWGDTFFYYLEACGCEEDARMFKEVLKRTSLSEVVSLERDNIVPLKGRGLLWGDFITVRSPHKREIWRVEDSSTLHLIETVEVGENEW